MNKKMIPGQSFPLGATVRDGGVNFSVFSRNATRIDLLFFKHVDDKTPSRVISLDPIHNRTYHYWHVFIPKIKPGQLYAYRAHGPFNPVRGMRFDASKVLLDPYGKGVAEPFGYSRLAASSEGDNASMAMKSVVVETSSYDWEGDLPLRHPSSKTIIYEMHVRGFTMHESSGIGAKKRGTYAGLIEKIPYLKELGISAVELLPIFHFDRQDAPLGQVNYWGYSPISFFAPHAAYSSNKNPLGVIDEFRDMVKSMHKAGIEVILDVVFNHTAEGNHKGPTLCFKGFANDTYYMLEQEPRWYSNYSGTGNTFNANNPIVRRLILDSLRYWVSEMHVDGFRFDLASILSRDESGALLPKPPILWDIESDPVLAGTKFIAEAWDAAGLYQVGNFIGDAWKEWNGRFRDDVRSFFRCEPNSVSRFVNRLLGSPDIYEHAGREAEKSINFVTCHDGLTLNDLVSYNNKHNEANGEGNRDGTDDNRSWNCGVEGPSDDPDVEKLRLRQIKNFLTMTTIALGVPMILMGDEVRRTQYGNNNAYCQDNELNWFDWNLLPKNENLIRFVKMLTRLHSYRSSDPERSRMSLNQLLKRSTTEWHGVHLHKPDFSAHSHSIALTAISEIFKYKFHVFFNAYWQPLTFDLPKLPKQRHWYRLIDTALPSPNDIVRQRDATIVIGRSYRAQPHSIVVLSSMKD